MLELIGLLLAAIAATASIIGSWGVSSGDNNQRRCGFAIWLCGNPITMIVLIGVILNIWSGLPLVFSLVTQVYFFYTAYRGWKSNGETT
jgi:hypothetical protein